MKLTKAQKRNLETLANYLDSLPPDYTHFDMATYLGHDGDCGEDPEEILQEGHTQEYIQNCGTVACAVGHGPAAGIKLRRSELFDSYSEIDWNDYSARVFGCHPTNYEYQPECWHFLFSSDWSECDNTPQGAAARIRYILAGGTPIFLNYFSSNKLNKSQMKEKMAEYQKFLTTKEEVGG
jgi:hypothetical protein